MIDSYRDLDDAMLLIRGIFRGFVLNHGVTENTEVYAKPWLNSYSTLA